MTSLSQTSCGGNLSTSRRAILPVSARPTSRPCFLHFLFAVAQGPVSLLLPRWQVTFWILCRPQSSTLVSRSFSSYSFNISTPMPLPMYVHIPSKVAFCCEHTKFASSSDRHDLICFMIFGASLRMLDFAQAFPPRSLGGTIVPCSGASSKVAQGVEYHRCRPSSGCGTGKVLPKIMLLVRDRR